MSYGLSIKASDCIFRTGSSRLSVHSSLPIILRIVILLYDPITGRVAKYIIVEALYSLGPHQMSPLLNGLRKMCGQICDMSNEVYDHFG